jgi:hypothetical protein
MLFTRRSSARVDLDRSDPQDRRWCRRRIIASESQQEKVMRNVIVPGGKLFIIALVIAGCSRSSEPTTPAPSAIDSTAALSCNPPKHLCPSCNGGQICALRCPECAPPVAPAPDPSALTGATAAVTCIPPQRQCLDCTGQPICARFCPECPAPLAPRPDSSTVADITPVVETCGGRVCSPGTHCCNASCGICTPKGVECTQQACN